MSGSILDLSSVLKGPDSVLDGNLSLVNLGPDGNLVEVITLCLLDLLIVILESSLNVFVLKLISEVGLLESVDNLVSVLDLHGLPLSSSVNSRILREHIESILV